MTMYIAYRSPSPNVLGGETGVPEGNHPETAGYMSFFSNKENAKNLLFKEFNNCFPIMGKCNGDKLFLPEKHTAGVAQLGYESRSLVLKLHVSPLRQLLPLVL